MTLAELRASLKRARQRVRKYTLAVKRNKKLAAKRKRQIANRTSGPKAAVRWALNQAGITENPPGSNRGGKITLWQSSFGEWLVGQPWCGVFVGTAMRKAGVNSVTSRVAAVMYIEDDARAGRNGFERLVPVSQAKPGDCVCLFGRGVHVGMVVRNHGTWLETIEGNTSSSNSGSQSNGGGVFARSRPYSAVHAVARPRWPH